MAGPAPRHTAWLNASLTFSGVKGIERILTPIASKTAFEIAEGTTAAEGSPAPQGFSFGRSIKSIAISGTWESQDRVRHPIDARHRRAVELEILNERAANSLNDIALDLILEPVRIDDRAQALRQTLTSGKGTWQGGSGVPQHACLA